MVVQLKHAKMEGWEEGPVDHESTPRRQPTTTGRPICQGRHDLMTSKGHMHFLQDVQHLHTQAGTLCARCMFARSTPAAVIFVLRPSRKPPTLAAAMVAAERCRVLGQPLSQCPLEPQKNTHTCPMPKRLHAPPSDRTITQSAEVHGTLTADTRTYPGTRATPIDTHTNPPPCSVFFSGPQHDTTTSCRHTPRMRHKCVSRKAPSTFVCLFTDI